MLQAGFDVVLCDDFARDPFAAPPIVVAVRGNFSVKTRTSDISLLPKDDWPRRCD